MQRPSQRNDKDQQTLKHGTHIDIAASTSNASNTACDLLQVLAQPMLTYQSCDDDYYLINIRLVC